MLRIKKYIEKIINPYLILKYNFFNIYEIPNFEKIKINLIINNLPNEYSNFILDGFKILQIFFNQTPYFSKFYSYYKGRNRIYLIVLSLTLRKRNLYNFLTFFLNISYFYFIQNKIKLTYILDSKGNFSFILRNLNPFFLYKYPFNYKHSYFQIIIYNNLNIRKKVKKFISLKSFFLDFYYCLHFYEIFIRKK